MTSHQYCNGNLAIILSLMSFSFITHFLSFGSLVGIPRPLRNAADDDGYKRHFCSCSNLASSRSERLKYVLNIFEIFSKCSWWWWLTRDVFVLARIWHRPGLNVWNMAPTSDHTLHFKGWKYKRPLFDFFLTFHFQKNSNSSCYGVQVR